MLAVAVVDTAQFSRRTQLQLKEFATTWTSTPQVMWHGKFTLWSVSACMTLQMTTGCQLVALKDNTSAFCTRQMNESHARWCKLNVEVCPAGQQPVCSFILFVRCSNVQCCDCHVVRASSMPEPGTQPIFANGLDFGTKQRIFNWFQGQEKLTVFVCFCHWCWISLANQWDLHDKTSCQPNLNLFQQIGFVLGLHIDDTLDMWLHVCSLLFVGVHVADAHELVNWTLVQWDAVSDHNFAHKWVHLVRVQLSGVWATMRVKLTICWCGRRAWLGFARMICSLDANELTQQSEDINQRAFRVFLTVHSNSGWLTDWHMDAHFAHKIVLARTGSDTCAEHDMHVLLLRGGINDAGGQTKVSWCASEWEIWRKLPTTEAPCRTWSLVQYLVVNRTMQVWVWPARVTKKSCLVCFCGNKMRRKWSSSQFGKISKARARFRRTSHNLPTPLISHKANQSPQSAPKHPKKER